MAGKGSGKQTDRVKRDQENAAFRLLPFAVDVFGRQTLRLKRAEFLPVRHPKSLTLEVVEALEHVIQRGVLAFLCRQGGGWRQRARVVPGREDPQRDVRLIDPKIWKDQGLKLSFSAQSIDALIIAYNTVCETAGQQLPAGAHRTKKDKYPKSIKMDFATNGDILVHHILWMKLLEAPFEPNKAYTEYFQKNPLTMLARGDTKTSSASKVIARLLEPDMEPLMPWFGPHLVKCWKSEESSCWSKLEQIDRFHVGMGSYGAEFLRIAREEERRDLLLPFVSLFKALFLSPKSEDQWESDFQRLVHGKKISERDEYRRRWAKHVRLGWTLHEEYGEARSVHPIDREAADQIYMESIEADPYEETAWRARAFANQLDAVIS